MILVNLYITILHSWNLPNILQLSRMSQLSERPYFSKESKIRLFAIQLPLLSIPHNNFILLWQYLLVSLIDDNSCSKRRWRLRWLLCIWKYKKHKEINVRDKRHWQSACSKVCIQESLSLQHGLGQILNNVVLQLGHLWVNKGS